MNDSKITAYSNVQKGYPEQWAEVVLIEGYPVWPSPEVTPIGTEFAVNFTENGYAIWFKKPCGKVGGFEMSELHGLKMSRESVLKLAMELERLAGP